VTTPLSLQIRPQGSPSLATGGVPAAGIVFIVTGDMSVASSGTITATPAHAERDEAASGGYVFIRGGSLVLGNSLVTARGGVATSVSAPTQGRMINASPGYVVLQTRGTVNGATDPPANIIAGP
jgi:hydrogenase maturation factor HypE